MQFTDVGENHRYFREISSVVDHGLMAGMIDGSFAAEKTITVAEFMLLINYILGYGKILFQPGNDKTSRKTEHGHWAESYLISCRALGIDYSPELLPDSEISLNEALKIMNSLAKELSNRFQLKFHYDYNLFFKTYYLFYNKNTPITREQEACLAYWFCSNLADQILKHDTHILNNELFIATEPAHFFLSFFNFTSQTDFELTLIAHILYQEKCPLLSVYESMKRILISKNEVLQSLQYKSLNNLYHYTTLSALIALAPNSFGFRLSNSAFLNDPSEGKLLVQEFQNRFTSPSFLQLTNYLPLNRTYLASFNPNDDSLPMWFQYGDKAAGCAIGFDPRAFKYPVYCVQYDLKLFEPFFKQVEAEFQGPPKDPTGHATFSAPPSPIYNYASLCLDELSYLYKDPHYRHEEELRIIIRCHPRVASKEDRPREGELLPRTFVNVPYKISAVTFGVNVPAPQKLAVGLASIGLDCPFKSSNIPFRN